VRLRIEPIYGWGWGAGDGHSIDEPGPFHIDCATAAPAAWPGLIIEQDHLLSGLWVELSARNSAGYFNLCAFGNENLARARGGAMITGFAMLGPTL
jgi:hypothetical protein